MNDCITKYIGVVFLAKRLRRETEKERLQRLEIALENNSISLKTESEDDQQITRECK